MKFFVLFLLAIAAVTRAQQVIENPEMNGCNGGDGVVDIWEARNGFPPPLSLNYDTSSFVITGSPTPPEDDCAAVWQPGDSDYFQTLSLAGIQAGGRYEFRAYFACVTLGQPGSCEVSLLVGNVPITLIGSFSKDANDQVDTFDILTASAIIAQDGDEVSLFCETDGVVNNIYCLITQATLTFIGGASEDPHFRGWNGIPFDFIGKAGYSYNIITDVDLSVCIFSLSSFPFLLSAFFCDRLIKRLTFSFFFPIILCR